MSARKKKPLADIGTVLRKLTSPEALKPWADYMASIDPWKRLEIAADTLLGRWTAPGAPWWFYSAADPKNAKIGGFDHEHGLVVFCVDGRAVVEGFLKTSLPEGFSEEGGYVQAIATKNRHKGVGKYLLHAAERVISEKHKRIFLFVSESNAAAQRFYKSAGYEEIARVSDCIKPGNTEILMTKSLA
ncbi:MAG: GNAT family N-acetyltransferase [Deltaproteobacteria bacterium]|nr:GNAT family N-acetyltransferase [Deltaproteobacteria bacterium]